jgi:hypothetical protein
VPYIVRPGRVPRTALAACGALLVLGAGSAQAASPPDTSTCEAPVLSQPFLYANDSNYYKLAPGQSSGSFDGKGWVLSGGAKIKQTKLENGKPGPALDLPSGSQAVSPTFCVSSEYPTARTMVRNVVGSEGVFFYVSYGGTNTWEAPKNTGQVHGDHSEWTLSDPVNMQPENIVGWQLVRITLVAGGNPSNPSDFQVNNLYIDPYRR